MQACKLRFWLVGGLIRPTLSLKVLGVIRLSNLKLSSLAVALALGTGAVALSACSAVSDTYDYLMDTNDSQKKEPTGYYQHAFAQEYQDPLQVPADLGQPYTDTSFTVPEVAVTKESRTLVGGNMDVRPPVVAQVSELGVEVTNSDQDAVLWFMPYNQFGVQNEKDAWDLLTASLGFMQIPVANADTERLILDTAAFDYNAYGEPYDTVSMNFEAPRYSQTYKIQVGHAMSGQVGYYIALITSSTLTSDGELVGERLNLRQKSSFAVGMGNSIIKAMMLQSQAKEEIPDTIQVLLSRDNNDQDALIVKAPYTSTWNVLRGLLEQYSFTIDEYSISRSNYKVEVNEEDPEFYRALGVEPFGLESGTYIVRLAVAGDNTVITFYDEDDKPLPTTKVAGLYAGFAQALQQEFAVYKREGAAYLAKFIEED